MIFATHAQSNTFNVKKIKLDQATEDKKPAVTSSTVNSTKNEFVSYIRITQSNSTYISNSIENSPMK